ncbi:transmembrane protein 79 [Pseudophryne corroboree]|uniref:transmembrane protein 79 n=1 Tax=Pseudophryne corroboree TaxID=495146 RepID=UPI003081644E
METKQEMPVKPDASQKNAEDNGAGLASEETLEQRKKSRSVGFYEMDVLRPSIGAEAKEGQSDVRCWAVEENEASFPNADAASGCSDNPEGSLSNQIEDLSPKYFDQALPSSPSRCQKHGRPTCLCKECVENYMNLCEEVQEPGIADQKKAEEASLSDDCASLNSNSRFEASRHTDSSEEECQGNAQVTLPYPDNSRPPDCITRLSNAGLYEPSEDLAAKMEGGNEGEENISQVAFFVEHLPLEKQLGTFQAKDELELCEKVDIEKGDPELEPLVRTPRRQMDEELVHPGCCFCHQGSLKIVGSFVVSMLVFPALLYAAYAWLPFDAPVMTDIPTRLVYTLRCAAFASFPIVLGVVIHGTSRLCVSSFNPFKPREREVKIHRRFVKQSTFLFVLYFFNLSVLATYLPQGQLKFIPLLTCLFALSQLIYWLSFAVGRSFRGFGYGLTFLPLLAMLICNIYFMFVVEPEKMVFLGSRH